MKRFVSVLLSASLLLGLVSGCTDKSSGSDGKTTGEVPMGRYVEEQGEILENMRQVYDFKSTGDGGYTFYGSIPQDDFSGKADFNLYTVPAGSGPITSEKVPGLSEFAPTGVRDMARGSDGTLYVLYYVGTSYQMGIAKSVNGGPFEPIEVADLKPAASGGTASPAGSISMGGGTVFFGGSGDSGEGEASPEPTGGVDLPESTDGVETTDGLDAESNGAFSFNENSLPSKMATGIRALADGGFLVLYGTQGASRYSADGTLQGEYSGNAFRVAMDGNTLLLNSTDGASLWSYDMAANKQDGTYTYDNINFGTQVYMDSESVYLADSSGIYRQTKGSTIWERLVDGDLTSLVMPKLSINGFASDGKGGFAALLGNEDSTQFMRYTYSATTPTNPDTELSIFSLRDNNTVRQAIGEFQRRNPNVRVNFRVGMDDDSSATAEDVIRALNTELLAGKGPDLLLLDGLPVDSYIEKGVLLDLTDFIGAQSDLLSNLTNAYAKDGKLYGMPSRFTFPVMMGKAADVDSITSLRALVDRVKQDQGGPALFLRPSNDLWSEDGVGIMMDYYNSCSGSFLKEDGTIDADALASFFSAMQELDKTMKEHSPQSDGSAAFVTMSIAASGSAAGVEEVDMGPSDLKAGTALFHTQEMAGVFALNFVSQNLSGMADQKLAALFGGSAYTPKGGVGLNAAGKQQDLAKSFMEMLLSRTVQDNYLYDGYPVNAKSLDKLVTDTLEGESDMGFLDLCKTLDTPLLADAVIKDAVQAQMKSLMDGSATPEQAAATVVEKTQIYLAE